MNKTTDCFTKNQSFFFVSPRKQKWPLQDRDPKTVPGPPQAERTDVTGGFSDPKKEELKQKASKQKDQQKSTKTIFKNQQKKKRKDQKADKKW